MKPVVVPIFVSYEPVICNMLMLVVLKMLPRIQLQQRVPRQITIQRNNPSRFELLLLFVCSIHE